MQARSFSLAILTFALVVVVAIGPAAATGGSHCHHNSCNSSGQMR